jgi:hypothetical protein
MNNKRKIMDIMATHDNPITFSVIRQESELDNSNAWMALMDLVKDGKILQNDRLFSVNKGGMI